MDPISAGIGIVSLGMQLYGGIKASEDAHQAAQIQQSITTLDMSANAQRQQAMELSASRQKLEDFRQAQRLHAQSENNAVESGSQFGSGYAGGQAQITDQNGYNILGVNQNLQIGRNIFGIDNQIDNQKIALSGVQSQQATDQGIASFGQSLGKSAGTISNVANYAGAQMTNFGNYVGSQMIPSGALSGGLGGR